MSRSTASSMFGGAGGRGSRASVSSLEGLRNALRPEGNQQQHPQPQPPSQKNVPPATVPADDKTTLKGLNERLSEYLEKVRKLRKYNKDLEEEIDEILKKRGETTSPDWDEIEKPLDDLSKQVHDLTMDNAALLLEVDNNKMANEDLKNKLDTEQISRQILEHDLADLRRAIDDTHLVRLNLESQLESNQKEIDYLKKDHSDEVDALKKKIKESDVKVETDSSQSKLSSAINKIREQYEKIAVKNREDTNEWYRTKFENIKVEVSKNTESLQNSTTELKEIKKKKQLCEIEISTLRSTISSLDNTLKAIQGRKGNEIAYLNNILQKMEAELRHLRENIERQVQVNKNLTGIKMELENEISSYRNLLGEVESSVDIILEQALQSHDPAQDSKTDDHTAS